MPPGAIFLFCNNGPDGLAFAHDVHEWVLPIFLASNTSTSRTDWSLAAYYAVPLDRCHSQKIIHVIHSAVLCQHTQQTPVYMEHFYWVVWKVANPQKDGHRHKISIFWDPCINMLTGKGEKQLTPLISQFRIPVLIGLSGLDSIKHNGIWPTYWRTALIECVVSHRASHPEALSSHLFLRDCAIGSLHGHCLNHLLESYQCPHY